MSEKTLLFLSENTLCLWDAYEPLPDDILENGPHEFKVFRYRELAKMYLASKFSFEDALAYGIEAGITVGKVYHKGD